MPRFDSKEFDYDIPIRLENIYGGSQNCLAQDGLVKESLSFEEKNYGYENNCSRVLDYGESEEADETMLLLESLK